MTNQPWQFFLLGMMFLCFVGLSTGCVNLLWSGAQWIYDRHDVYKKIDDYTLSRQVSRLLLQQKRYYKEDGFLEYSVFNQDVLIAGCLPSAALRQQLFASIRQLTSYRSLYNQVSVRQICQQQALYDSWLTTKIRSQIFSDASIAPRDFKIITVDKIVYIMGDVKKDQAERVIEIACGMKGVKRVVKLMKYYTLLKI